MGDFQDMPWRWTARALAPGVAADGRKTKCEVRLLDTVFFGESPSSGALGVEGGDWLFTSKHGTVQLKKPDQVTPARVADRFGRFAMMNPLNTSKVVARHFDGGDISGSSGGGGISGAKALGLDELEAVLNGGGGGGPGPGSGVQVFLRPRAGDDVTFVVELDAGAGGDAAAGGAAGSSVVRVSTRPNHGTSSGSQSRGALQPLPKDWEPAVRAEMEGCAREVARHVAAGAAPVVSLVTEFMVDDNHQPWLTCVPSLRLVHGGRGRGGSSDYDRGRSARGGGGGGEPGILSLPRIPSRGADGGAGSQHRPATEPRGPRPSADPNGNNGGSGGGGGGGGAPPSREGSYAEQKAAMRAHLSRNGGSRGGSSSAGAGAGGLSSRGGGNVTGAAGGGATEVVPGLRSGAAGSGAGAGEAWTGAEAEEPPWQSQQSQQSQQPRGKAAGKAAPSGAETNGGCGAGSGEAELAKRYTSQAKPGGKARRKKGADETSAAAAAAAGGGVDVGRLGAFAAEERRAAERRAALQREQLEEKELGEAAPLPGSSSGAGTGGGNPGRKRGRGQQVGALPVVGGDGRGSAGAAMEAALEGGGGPAVMAALDSDAEEAALLAQLERLAEKKRAAQGGQQAQQQQQLQKSQQQAQAMSVSLPEEEFFRRTTAAGATLGPLAGSSAAASFSSSSSSGFGPSAAATAAVGAGPTTSSTGGSGGASDGAGGESGEGGGAGEMAGLRQRVAGLTQELAIAEKRMGVAAAQRQQAMDQARDLAGQLVAAQRKFSEVAAEKQALFESEKLKLEERHASALAALLAQTSHVAGSPAMSEASKEVASLMQVRSYDQLSMHASDTF